MSLKGLAKLKREGRTSLHAVQYKWQSCSVLMFCSYFNNGWSKHFLLMFLFCFYFFPKINAFCSYKIVLITKSVWLFCTNYRLTCSDIRFPCKCETHEKIGCVIFYTVF